MYLDPPFVGCKVQLKVVAEDLGLHPWNRDRRMPVNNGLACVLLQLAKNEFQIPDGRLKDRIVCISYCLKLNFGLVGLLFWLVLRGVHSLCPSHQARGFAGKLMIRW